MPRTAELVRERIDSGTTHRPFSELDPQQTVSFQEFVKNPVVGERSLLADLGNPPILALASRVGSAGQRRLLEESFNSLPIEVEITSDNLELFTQAGFGEAPKVGDRLSPELLADSLPEVIVTYLRQTDLKKKTGGKFSFSQTQLLEQYLLWAGFHYQYSLNRVGSIWKVGSRMGLSYRTAQGWSEGRMPRGFGVLNFARRNDRCLHKEGWNFGNELTQALGLIWFRGRRAYETLPEFKAETGSGESVLGMGWQTLSELALLVTQQTTSFFDFFKRKDKDLIVRMLFNLYSSDNYKRGERIGIDLPRSGREARKVLKQIQGHLAGKGVYGRIRRTRIQPAVGLALFIPRNQVEGFEVWLKGSSSGEVGEAVPTPGADSLSAIAGEVIISDAPSGEVLNLTSVEPGDAQELNSEGALVTHPPVYEEELDFGDGEEDEPEELFLGILDLVDVDLEDPEDLEEAISAGSVALEGDEGQYPDDLSDIEVGDTITLYLKEMAQTPLLTAEEERELAKLFETGKMARQRLNENGYESERRERLEQEVEEGMMARDHLIKANTRLVVSIAKRYLAHGVPFLDLIQEGNLGLMKAVEKFDYRRGYRLSTYATWWIRQYVTRALAEKGRIIRVPVHMSDHIRKLYRIGQELEQELGRQPTPEELAEETKLSVSKVRWMLRASRHPISLERPIGREEDQELGDFVKDEEAPSPEQIAYEHLLKEKMKEVLGTLNPREARILRLRFGLQDGRVYTLEEVGQKFGLTRERIRQIEAEALKKLRHPRRLRQFKDYLG